MPSLGHISGALNSSSFFFPPSLNPPMPLLLLDEPSMQREDAEGLRTTSRRQKGQDLWLETYRAASSTSPPATARERRPSRPEIARHRNEEAKQTNGTNKWEHTRVSSSSRASTLLTITWAVTPFAFLVRLRRPAVHGSAAESQYLSVGVIFRR